jgi:hypothetical protein
MKSRAITPRQLARAAIKGQQIPSAQRKPIEDKLTAWLTAAAAVIALEEAVSMRAYRIAREGFLQPKGPLSRKEWLALAKAIKGGKLAPVHYLNGVVRDLLKRTPRVELDEKKPRRVDPLIISAMNRGRVRK